MSCRRSPLGMDNATVGWFVRLRAFEYTFGLAYVERDVSGGDEAAGWGRGEERESTEGEG
jgi:hypothetical protein